jgi:hypothetical protein
MLGATMVAGPIATVERHDSQPEGQGAESTRRLDGSTSSRPPRAWAPAPSSQRLSNKHAGATG